MVNEIIGTMIQIVVFGLIPFLVYAISFKKVKTYDIWRFLASAGWELLDSVSSNITS
ncbi:hypothetical protein LCGC14_2235230 [marine sediment metagenome]|uniref:Uncharacterized protein n=1 Tax=marine sediment metagenome TaxID=412755 RepID=A0A0F9DUL9_9ZZZZ